MQLDQLLDLWEKLAERERKVFMTFGYRLFAGQRKYGPLTKAKKDWNFESLEEVLDASVYLTCALSDRVDKAFDNAVKAAEDEIAEEANDPDWPYRTSTVGPGE